MPARAASNAACAALAAPSSSISRSVISSILREPSSSALLRLLHLELLLRFLFLDRGEFLADGAAARFGLLRALRELEVLDLALVVFLAHARDFAAQPPRFVLRLGEPEVERLRLRLELVAQARLAGNCSCSASMSRWRCNTPCSSDCGPWKTTPLRPKQCPAFETSMPPAGSTRASPSAFSPSGSRKNGDSASFR